MTLAEMADQLRRVMPEPWLVTLGSWDEPDDVILASSGGNVLIAAIRLDDPDEWVVTCFDDDVFPEEVTTARGPEGLAAEFLAFAR